MWRFCIAATAFEGSPPGRFSRLFPAKSRILPRISPARARPLQRPVVPRPPISFLIGQVSRGHLSGGLDVYRFALTIGAVGILSTCLAHLEIAQGQRSTSLGHPGTSWVRTSDGWERSDLLWLESRPFVRPALHPLLVAGFQLSASLFALIAFPSSGCRLGAGATRAARFSRPGRKRPVPRSESGSRRITAG